MASREPRRRSVAIDPERFGVEGDGPVGTVFGYAAVFDQWAFVGVAVDPKTRKPFEVHEIIRPGAFDYAIENRQDVRALVEHDFKLPLGRVAAGTLRLSVDDYGLRYEVDLTDTTRAVDLVKDIRHKNIVGSSFTYLPRPNGERVNMRPADGRMVAEAEILSVDLFDVSPVSVPVYRGTSALSRSESQAETDKRAYMLGVKARLDALSKLRNNP